MTIRRTAIWGAIALNPPTVVAAAFLPASAVFVMAVALAAIGAALGAVAALSFQPGQQELIELPRAVEERRAA